MKILICGSRHWTNYDSIISAVQRLVVKYGKENITIIEGGAPGADSLARQAAIECGISYKEFPADWGRFGRKAGPIRNQQMLDELDVTESGGQDMVVAFHEDIEKSRGTRDMVNRARKNGVPVYIMKE